MPLHGPIHINFNGGDVETEIQVTKAYSKVLLAIPETTADTYDGGWIDSEGLILSSIQIDGPPTEYIDGGIYPTLEVYGNLNLAKPVDTLWQYWQTALGVTSGIVPMGYKFRWLRFKMSANSGGGLYKATAYFTSI